ERDAAHSSRPLGSSEGSDLPVPKLGRQGSPRRLGRMSTPPDYGEGSWAGFGVIVSYDAERATLAVRGEVDLLTAPELGAIVDLVIDRDHRVVVLDLAELRFMDGSGLGVIAKGAERLRTTGGEFVLRSPSVLLARLLEITGLIDAVR